MFKLTEKAKAFNKFIVHSCEAAVTDYSTYESEQAVWEAVKSDEWVAEELAEGNKIEIIEKLFINSLAVFTASEMLEAAEIGYGWPIELGYVEEENLENAVESNK